MLLVAAPFNSFLKVLDIGEFNLTDSFFAHQGWVMRTYVDRIVIGVDLSDRRSQNPPH